MARSPDNIRGWRRQVQHPQAGLPEEIVREFEEQVPSKAKLFGRAD